MSQAELKKELQSYCFAAHDMLLFLDTHPDDKRGFEIYKALVQKRKELKNAYIQNFGPVDWESVAEGESFRWIQGPWPWEKGGNV